MEIAAIFSIIILFFAFALSKADIEKTLKIKVCAICYAVGFTWLGLLILNFANLIEIDKTLIAVLMGGSVVGIMYRLIKSWYLQLVELTGGFLAVYYLLNEKWENLFFSIVIFILIAGLLFIFFGIKNSQTTKNNTLKEKLEHCCD